jgi:TPR repeat protein
LPSTPYNLGLIYLDGVGQFTPKYDLERKYFKMANELGHERAEWSAQIIGSKWRA